MKKVLIYISSLNMGGAERVVTTLANKLQNTMDLVVLTDTCGKNEYDNTEGFKRVNMDYQVASNIVLRAINRFSYLYKLRKKIDVIKPDVIISFSIESGLRVQKALFLKKYKKIITVRSNPANDYPTKQKKDKISKKISANDGFIFQTEEQRDFFSEEIREKGVVIQNPINPEFLVPIDRTNIKKQIVTVGRLTKSKDHKTLLKAYDKVAEKFPDYEFIIYGEGELEQETHRIWETLTHKNQIVLYGAIKEVREKIKNAAVFVLSSSNEGLPNSLMEAMAMGIPVVSTDCPCGGPKSLIRDNENGYLVPVGDDILLAEKIANLLQNKELAHSFSVNATKIRDICNEDLIATEWDNYLEKVIQN